MKKKFLLLGSIVLLAVGGLSACKNKDKVTAEDVSVSGLYTYYYTSDTIMWDEIKLLVTDSNDELTTLSKCEYDISSNRRASDTEFILETDGLYDLTKNGETIPTGTYNISYTIPDFHGKSYSDDLFTVNVLSSLKGVCTAELYSQPEFVTTYERNIDTRVDYSMEGEESAFFKSCDYTIGDDNPFVYRPVLELSANSDPNGPRIYPNGYPAEVSVTYSNVEQDLTSNPYFTFDSRNFAFQFTSEAIGKSFTITISPSEFSEDFYGFALDPESLTVNVQDGYNVTKALDLGRINLVSSDWDENRLALYTQAGPSGDVYWKATSSGTGEYYNEYYSETWERFLSERGETDLAPVNGIFLHGDIEVTQEDLPEEFFISEEELSTQGSSANFNYGEVVGSLRDEIYIYTKVMEDKDFVVNGNMFTIDCSSLKWCMTRYNEESNRLSYYTRNETGYAICQCGLFGVSEVVVYSDETYPDWVNVGLDKKEASFINIEAHGNQERAYFDEETDTNEDSSKASGTVRFIKTFGGRVIADNNIAINFVQAYYANYTPAICSNESYKTTANTFFGIYMTNCKVLDCYAVALYNCGSAYNYSGHTLAKRFGGPIILNTSIGDDEEYRRAGWDTSSDCVFESLLYGTEAWFSLLGISSIVSYFTYFDNAFTGAGPVLISTFHSLCYNKSIMNSNGQFDVIYIGMEQSISTASPIDIDFYYEGYDFYYKSGDTLEELDASVPDAQKPYDYNWVTHAYFGEYGRFEYNIGGFYLPTFVTNSGKIFCMNVSEETGEAVVHLVNLTDFYTKWLAAGGSSENNLSLESVGTNDIKFDETDTFVLCLEDSVAMKICIGMTMFDYPYVTEG